MTLPDYDDISAEQRRLVDELAVQGMSIDQAMRATFGDEPEPSGEQCGEPCDPNALCGGCADFIDSPKPRPYGNG